LPKLRPRTVYSSPAPATLGDTDHVIRFDDRVVVVTGAGRGLGAAYARLFAARGATVVVHDAGVERSGEGDDPSVADAVVDELRRAGGRATAAYENLEDEDACRLLIEAVVADHGRLDVLVNNAGLVVYEEVDRAGRSWETMRRVGIDAPFHLSRAAFPAMKRQQYGRLVFTTSGIAMSTEDTRPGLSAYAAAKMAQFGLMVVFAAEGRPHGVLANAISPVAATRVYTQPVAPGALDPTRVAPGVVFLASEACTITGVVLGAADGWFGVRSWGRSAGVDLGDGATPEAVADRWDDIAKG
jgi:NAD(P)-dependent dehydrogenase (short-subunit alcohol dehydrogenase family)